MTQKSNILDGNRIVHALSYIQKHTTKPKFQELGPDEKDEEFSRIFSDAVFANELSEAEKITVQRAKKLLKFFSQPFFTAEKFTNVKGEYVPVAETVDGVEKILKGEYDDFTDEPFYMSGNIGTVEEKWKKLH